MTKRLNVLNLIRKFRLEILIFLVFVVLRLPDLGHDNFNTDVWKWKARIYDFGQGVFTLDFEKTIQKYHPGVTLMWIGTAAVKVFNLYYDVVYKMPPPDNSLTTVFQLDFVIKLFIVVVLGVCFALVFNLLKRILSFSYAVIAVSMLMLEPFYMGLTRVIHLEALMTIFMLLSFLYLYYGLSHSKKSIDFALSAFFGALAVLTKTSAIFVVPFAWLLIAYMDFYTNRFSFSAAIKTHVKPMLKWTALFVLCFVAIWPGMWTNPLDAFDAMYRGVATIGIERGHEQIYFGKYFEDPGFTFYPVVILLKSSPHLILGLIFFVLALVFKKVKSIGFTFANDKKFIGAVALFALFYFIEISIPSKKLDRYIIPSVAALIFIAAYFYNQVFYVLACKIKKATSSSKSKYAAYALPLVFLASIGALDVAVHPDYFSYHNPLFGGLAVGVQVLEPKWLIGKDETVAYFKTLMVDQNYMPFAADETIDDQLDSPTLGSKLTVGFQEKYYTQIYPFINEIGARAIIQDLTPHAVKAQYFVYPVWDDQSINEDRFDVEYTADIKIGAVTVYRVYKRLP